MSEVQFLDLSVDITNYPAPTFLSGMLGAAQEAVPGRVDPQGDRGVQQAVQRLVVQLVRAGERSFPGDGRQVSGGRVNFLSTWEGGRGDPLFVSFTYRSRLYERNFIIKSNLHSAKI
jgi:hypothetical protein